MGGGITHMRTPQYQHSLVFLATEQLFPFDSSTVFFALSLFIFISMTPLGVYATTSQFISVLS